MSPSPVVSACDFFAALYEGVGHDWIEIRPLLDKSDPRYSDKEARGKAEYEVRRFFEWPKHLAVCADYCLKISGAPFHVYFGVALRKNSKAGTKKDCGVATCVFADVDWKDAPAEKVREILASFPLKPSIVVRSGRGVHIYWRIRPFAFESAFDRVERVNAAILTHFGAQRGPQDVSRLLRVPQTMNVKSDAQVMCEVSYWHPEFRYTLEDFEKIFPPEPPLIQAELKTSSPATAGGGGVGPQASTPPPLPPPISQPEEPTLEFKAEALERIAIMLKGIWLPGYRHRLAMCVAGWCAHSGYVEQSATKLVESVVYYAKDEEGSDRAKAVETSYAKYLAGERVAGLSAFEREAIAQFPEQIHAPISNVFEAMRRHVPKRIRRDHVAADFAITKFVQFNSRPSLYTITVHHGKASFRLESVPRDVTFNFSLFRDTFFEEHRIWLAPITRAFWDKMTGEAAKNPDIFELKEAPQEASPRGSFEATLDEFVSQKKESPEKGTLQRYAGYDDQAVYFKLRALKAHVKESGLKFNDYDICNNLKSLGWSDTRKWVENGSERIWLKKIESNGHHKKPEPPSIFGDKS